MEEGIRRISIGIRTGVCIYRILHVQKFKEETDMKNRCVNTRRAKIPFGRTVVDKKTKAERRSVRKESVRKEVREYVSR